MRVLVARAGALGDILLLRPALWRLRASGLSVTLLAPARTASLLVGTHPCQADLLLDADSREAARLFGGDVPAAWHTALRACDLGIAYTRSRELVAALERVIRSVHAHDPRPPNGMQAATWLCAPVQRLGLAEPPPLPVLPVVAPAERGQLVVHAGSGSAHKNWPAACFIEAAARLGAGRAWTWLAGPAEAHRESAPPGARLVSSPPLAELAALLAGARLYLGNDSGVTHLAAAVGAPTLALFGPTEAATWSPVGPRVTCLQAPAGDLRALAVESVVRAALARAGEPT